MHWSSVVCDRITAANRGDTMHHLKCPQCSTGTKCLVFIWTDGGKRPVVLGKYSSCDCRLTEGERLAMSRDAAKEAALA